MLPTAAVCAVTKLAPTVEANRLPVVLKPTANTVALLLRPPAPTKIFDTLITVEFIKPLTLAAANVALVASTLPVTFKLAPLYTVPVLPMNPDNTLPAMA